jgi:hypothetical protein
MVELRSAGELHGSLQDDYGRIGMFLSEKTFDREDVVAEERNA